jgi:membrane associated rhomboid family serine protease
MGLAVMAFDPVHPQWWQFVTYAFVHATWWHLALNAIAAYSFGRAVYRAVGLATTLAVFLFCAAYGALVYWMSMGTLPLVGASAGILGLMTYLAMIRSGSYYWLFVRVRGPVLIGVLFALTVFCIVTGAVPVIAHWAHFGGIVGGVVCGLLWRKRRYDLLGVE